MSRETQAKGGAEKDSWSEPAPCRTGLAECTQNWPRRRRVDPRHVGRGKEPGKTEVGGRFGQERHVEGTTQFGHLLRWMEPDRVRKGSLKALRRAEWST